MEKGLKDIDWGKYHRNKPIKEFDLNQTMYTLVKNESKDDLNLYAAGFFGNNITYNELFESTERLANKF